MSCTGLGYLWMSYHDIRQEEDFYFALGTTEIDIWLPKSIWSGFNLSVLWDAEQLIFPNTWAIDKEYEYKGTWKGENSFHLFRTLFNNTETFYLSDEYLANLSGITNCIQMMGYLTYQWKPFIFKSHKLKLVIKLFFLFRRKMMAISWGVRYYISENSRPRDWIKGLPFFIPCILVLSPELAGLSS